MFLDKILEDVVEEIEKLKILTKEQIRTCLTITNVSGKPHCTLFLPKLEFQNLDINDLYSHFKTAKFLLIKDFTTFKSSISFNINLIPYSYEILTTILEKGEDFGRNNIGNGETVVIDYSSPNIAKIFHMGHFRTTILGNFVKKIHAFCGYKAVGINYLGDWGKQFGLVLLGSQRFSNPEELKTDPIKYLFNVYVQISQAKATDPSVDVEAKKIFEKMEKGTDSSLLDKWSHFRELSINKYKELYSKLGVEFEEYSGESFYEKTCQDDIKKCSFLIKNSDGSVCLDLGKEKNPLVIKSDGTSLYLTRDFSAAKDRIARYNPKKLIYVVSSEQKEHFEDLFATLRKAEIFDNLEHVQYGMVSGMSTRKGTVKFLEDIIDIATDVMMKQIDANPEKKAQIKDVSATALNLAVSTLIIMDFSAKRIKGYKFDVEKRAMNTKGTGIYIQYAHCRLKSIEDMNKDIDLNKDIKIDSKCLEQEEILNLLYQFIWFEKVVISSFKDNEPNKLFTYVSNLCWLTNSYNSSLKVKGEEPSVAKTRLQVLKCARLIIGTTLKLFGLTPLNKM